MPKMPQFNIDEMRTLWEAITQYVENHDDDDIVPPAAFSAMHKLDALFASAAELDSVVGMQLNPVVMLQLKGGADAEDRAACLMAQLHQRGVPCHLAVSLPDMNCWVELD